MFDSHRSAQYHILVLNVHGPFPVWLSFNGDTVCHGITYFSHYDEV